MALDHEAIYKAYAGTVVTIDDSAGAFDKDGKSVSLSQTKINTARKALDDEAAAVKYKTDRTTNGSTVYASLGDQLDMLYKDMLAGKLDKLERGQPTSKQLKTLIPSHEQ